MAERPISHGRCSSRRTIVSIHQAVDLLPNALSFRVITTIEVESELEIPDRFSGHGSRLLRWARVTPADEGSLFGWWSLCSEHFA